MLTLSMVKVESEQPSTDTLTFAAFVRDMLAQRQRRREMIDLLVTFMFLFLCVFFKVCLQALCNDCLSLVYCLSNLVCDNRATFVLVELQATGFHSFCGIKLRQTIQIRVIGRSRSTTPLFLRRFCTGLNFQSGIGLIIYQPFSHFSSEKFVACTLWGLEFLFISHFCL